MLKYLKFNVVLSFISLFFLSACTTESVPGELKINLIQKVAGDKLVLNKWAYTSPYGHPFNVRRLQFVVSDFVLYSTEGDSIEYDMKHFYQFDKEDTKSFILPKIPPGSYDKLSFIFGLDEEKNTNNAYPSDYDMINFKWPEILGGGYHYMRFELTADSLSTGVIKNFNLHTGATNGNQNYLKIILDFDVMYIDGNSFSLDLVMDMNEWLQNPNTYNFEDYGHGIMANQAAQAILKANGYSAFLIEGPFELIH